MADGRAYDSGMAFEVPVAAVGRRSRRSWIPVLAAFMALVAGVAVVTAGRDGSAGQPGSSAVDGQGAAGVESVDVPRSMPERIDCRDLDRTVCLRVARAAVTALTVDAPTIRDATVWRSLLCSDNLECPEPYLEGSIPLGSVVVRFVDGGPRAAINVVEGRHGDATRLEARAWLARWMPEDGSG
jgi:hypothetical protein